jgi:hypothetical protein
MMLKKIDTTHHPEEARISLFFSSPELQSDPRNHCVPTYDVLHVPESSNTSILVMPRLRKYDDPPFINVGEAVDYFGQIIEV